MKVDAKTIKEYFSKAGDREALLRTIDDSIQKNAPKLERKLFVTDTMCMVGYGIFHYKTKSGIEGDWPVIALANQKHYAAAYVCAIEDGEYLAEKNQAELGKVSVGRSCIRIKKIEDLDLRAFESLVKKVASMYADGSNEFGV